MKPILLIIDGMDKAGKTTLINYINKQDNYLHLMLDRGPIGYKVYADTFDKEVNNDEYTRQEKELLNVKHLCIVLHAPNAVILSRFLKHNEPFGMDFIKLTSGLYDKYFDESKLNKIKINTHTNSIEQIYEVIKNEIKTIS